MTAPRARRAVDTASATYSAVPAVRKSFQFPLLICVFADADSRSSGGGCRHSNSKAAAAAFSDNSAALAATFESVNIAGDGKLTTDEYLQWVDSRHPEGYEQTQWLDYFNSSVATSSLAFA